MAVPIAIVVAAPQAGADCNYAGGSTVCAQGTVRGADGVPRAATPYVPYPCENDWYCGTDWDLNVDMDPGFGVGLPGASRWYRTTSMSSYTMTRQTLDEGANMMPSVRPARRAIKGAIGTGALAGAMLFGGAAVAMADPPPPVPPPCTAAELARVMSGVTFDTSNYLTDHPDVNDFFTSLKGQPRDQISDQVHALSRRQSGGSERPSGHPTTLGRLPPTLWGAGTTP